MCLDALVTVDPSIHPPWYRHRGSLTPDGSSTVTQECRRTDELLIYHTTHCTWSLGIFFCAVPPRKASFGYFARAVSPRAEATDLVVFS